MEITDLKKLEITTFLLCALCVNDSHDFQLIFEFRPRAEHDASQVPKTVFQLSLIFRTHVESRVHHDPILFLVSPFRRFVESAFTKCSPIAGTPGVLVSVHSFSTFTERSIPAEITEVVYVTFRYRAQRSEEVDCGILCRVAHRFQFMGDFA